MIAETAQRQAERQKAEAEEKTQVKYHPKSNATLGNTLVPINQAKPVADALQALQDRHGDIDQYVMKKLGYRDKEVLNKADLTRHWGVRPIRF